MSRVASRIQTRRNSRIGLRLSSIPPAFTRASAAYLDGVSYAANTPRYHSNSGIVGLLNEEATTNIALQSEALTTAPWGGSGHTLTAATSPRGDNSAWRIQSNTTSGNVIQSVAVTASTTYTFSFYAKNNGGTMARYRVYDNSGAADIVAPTSYLAAINNDTYTRITVTFTTPVGCTSIGIYVSNYATAGVDLFAWGVQLEAKAYATTYIPTTTAAVTRAAETTTVPTSGLLTPQAGSVTTEVYISRLTGTPSRYLFRVPDSGATDELYVGIVNNKWQAKAGSAAAVASTATVTTGAHYAVLVWSGSTWDVYVDGALVLSGTDNTPFAAFGATGYIGSDGTAKHINDGIRRQYFHTYRMSPAQAVAASLGNVPSDFTAYIRFTNGQMEVIQGHPWGFAELLPMFLDPPPA